MNHAINRRLYKDKIVKGLVILFACLCIIPLVSILFYIAKQGITSINWDFIVNIPKPVGEQGGGIANALVGSLIIVGMATAMAVPFGVLGGIYLHESNGTRLATWSRFFTDILMGVPSIVIGIIAYFWVVMTFGGFSAFSGSIALAIMMLPIIVKSTEETLKLLPKQLKESCLALGVPYHKTIIGLIIPSALSGIVSGILLAIARVAGETAPLLFTAFGNHYLSTSPSEPMQSLPLLIFNYATSPYEGWHNLAWGASFILIVWILLMNFTTKLIIKKWRITY
ncbi:phosphate transport system permease protein [Pedobacter sp. UYEF25]